MSNSGEGHGTIPYELAQKIGWPRAVSKAQRSSIHRETRQIEAVAPAAPISSENRSFTRKIAVLRLWRTAKRVERRQHAIISMRRPALAPAQVA